MRETRSIGCFLRAALSDDGGRTGKHHQQTFVLTKQKKITVLSSVGVSLAISKHMDKESGFQLAFKAPGEEPPALQQSSAEPALSLSCS